MFCGSSGLTSTSLRHVKSSPRLPPTIGRPLPFRTLPDADFILTDAQHSSSPLSRYRREISPFAVQRPLQTLSFARALPHIRSLVSADERPSPLPQLNADGVQAHHGDALSGIFKYERDFAISLWHFIGYLFLLLLCGYIYMRSK